MPNSANTSIPHLLLSVHSWALDVVLPRGGLGGVDREA
jgi:hypothetical protein